MSIGVWLAKKQRQLSATITNISASKPDINNSWFIVALPTVVNLARQRMYGWLPWLQPFPVVARLLMKIHVRTRTVRS
jgi:hypothetical protein